jgi:hypothetical protein
MENFHEIEFREILHKLAHDFRIFAKTEKCPTT